MTGYVRIDTINNIADGNVINAADLDGEFNGVQAAFNSSTGHTHDGTSAEGAPITKLGPVQDVTISTTVLGVKTTNTVDLGTSSLKFKDFYLAGAASIGGTLGVTGATTLSAALTYGGVTLSNAVTGTGNMVLSASPTLTGTITAAAANFSGAVALNGNTTIGDADTDTITQAASYVTGTQLKSAKTATNTLSLAAYDVDGTAYTNLITLTAANAPTLALTSTGVGTINNMSIGATTASTGAFTTLTSNGATTFTAGTASTTTGTGTLVITGGLGVSGRINAANFDGIVGANTAAAGSFTTLGATGVLSVTASAVSTIGGFSSTDAPTSMNLRLNRGATQFNGIAFAGAVTYDRGIYLRPSSDTINIGRSAGSVFTDQLSVDGAGLVGIAASSPSKLLTIGSSTTANPTVRLNGSLTGGSDTYQYSFGIDDTADFAGIKLNYADRVSKGLQIFTAPGYSFPITFYTNSATQAMTLDTSGNLGIGTTSPSVKLETSTARTATVTSAIFGLTGTGAVNDFNKITLKVQNTLGGGTGGAGIGAVLEASASNKTGLSFYYDSGSGVQTDGMRLNSSGNLGVGSGTTGLGKIEIQQSSTTAGLWVQTGGTTDSYIIADFRNGSNVSALKIFGNARSTFVTTVGVGEATPSTSGAGITFPATQSASSNVNTLDDYEEGTFTPTCTLATPGTSATTSAVGVYTKVGNLVTATGRLTFTKGTGSGDLSLGGLPFTSTNTTTYQNSGALSLDTFGVAGKVYYIILVNNSTVPILISITQAGGAGVAASASDFGAAGAAIRYTFSYQID